MKDAGSKRVKMLPGIWCLLSHRGAQTIKPPGPACRTVRDLSARKLVFGRVTVARLRLEIELNYHMINYQVKQRPFHISHLSS